MSKVLITGGAGFIGSHLAEYCLRQGDEVYIIDDLSTGSIDNIESIIQDPSVHFMHDTILNKEAVRQATDVSDRIYHLAASVGVTLIINNLVRSIENNVQGTETVLAAADPARHKILLASSSEVYGRSSHEPFREEDDLRMGATLSTRWSYACSKALDEYLGFAYWHERGLPVTVARLFNTIGERQSEAYGMVLPRFITQALANKPLTVYGDGEQTRCFCHVGDVVPALYQIMESDKTVGEVYNIGSNQEISINTLADRVIARLRSRSLPEHVAYDKVYKVGFDDIDRRVPNIKKLQDLIGFTPRYTIDDIIDRVTADIKAKQAGAQVALPQSS